jgi:hypothetical protein
VTALPQWSTPSEMTPILTPDPVRPYRARTWSASWIPSDSAVTEPVFVTGGSTG